MTFAVDAKMKGLLPMESDTKMSLKMQELMVGADSNSFSTLQMSDFNVPLFLFRQYCNAIKGLKNSLQDVLLNSLGVKTDEPDAENTVLVGWDPFI